MNYPKHVAIIPDGNRTWATENGFIKMAGHLEWFKRMIEIAEHVFTKTSIDVLTVWWLSTENLKNRKQDELEYLFDIYMKIPDQLEKTLKENNVKFRVAGNIWQLPQRLQDYFAKKTEETKDFPWEKTFVLAVNYGGQDEIVRGVNKMINDKLEMINSSDFSWFTPEDLTEYLDFGDLPNVNLVIRTKWDMAKRLSGFLLWWIGYAQLWFTAKKAPELTVEEFTKALDWYDGIIQYQNMGK